MGSKKPVGLLAGRSPPKGPRGERRPADVIGNAIKVAKIATEESPETSPPKAGPSKGAKKRGPTRLIP